MASPSTTVACSQKRDLLRDFAMAVAEVNRLHSAQVAAVLNDEGFRFQEELGIAEARRDNAKYAAITHQQEHGC